MQGRDSSIGKIRFFRKGKNRKRKYDDIRNKIPYYVFFWDNNYYKYVVLDDVTDELIEQLERAENLDLQIENSEKIKSIQKDVSFFKTLTVIWLILFIIGVCIAIILEI